MKRLSDCGDPLETMRGWWRDVLECNIGKAASGIMRADGISWQFGRGRSGPSID
jgi:hypothetical protein